MATATDNRRPSPPSFLSPLAPILALYGLAAIASTVQMLGDQFVSGVSLRILELLLGNLIAWLPWCPLALVSLTFERRVPLRSSLDGKTVATHALFGGLVSAAFLASLTLFRFASSPELTGELNLANWPRAYGREAGDFFLEAIGIYLLIVVLGAVFRSRRESATEGPTSSVIEIRSQGSVRFVATEEIDWIGAEGSYVRLHGIESYPLVRRSLASLAEELEPQGFARVHRSSLVNLARVRGIERLSHGDAILVMSDGDRVRVSRTYRGALRHLT